MLTSKLTEDKKLMRMFGKPDQFLMLEFRKPSSNRGGPMSNPGPIPNHQDRSAEKALEEKPRKTKPKRPKK